MGGLAAVSAALWIWVGLELGAAAGPAAGWIGALLAIPLAWLARRAPDRVGTVALALALLGASIARGVAARGTLEAASDALSPGAGPRWLTARACDHPRTEGGDPSAIVSVLRTEAGVAAGARLRLRLPAATAVEWGDTLRLLARLDRPRPRRAPGGYAAREAAWAQGIVAEGRALVVETAPAGRLARSTVTRWRRALERRFERELSAEAREIVTPLVVGDRSGLGADLGSDLRAAGLTHLIALSGLHVAWMAAVARGVVAAAGGGLAARAWAGASCALLYMGIAGPLPSLARAAGAELVAAAATLRGRALEPLQALGLSAAVLLVLSPGWAGDLGFQLSCAATFGLVTLGRAASAGLARLSRGRRGLAWAAGIVTPTAAAQVAALPLVLGRFHALPWTGLATNLLAVPVCELLLAAAWTGALLDLALPGAGRWCFGACEWLVAALRAIAGRAAGAPLSLLPTGHSPWPVGLAAVGVALVAVAALGPRDLVRARLGVSPRHAACAWLGATSLALALLLAGTAPTLRPPPGRWWIVTLDVGQGDAIAVGTRSGWWLVDAGPRSPVYDAGASVVMPFLRWAAVRRLEVMVLTHDHGDHTGGANAVRRGLPVGRVLIPAGTPFRAEPADARRVVAGDTVGRAPTVVARWPPRGFGSRDPNASSLALEIGDGRVRALLAADVDSVIESRLQASPGIAALKVAHHGAASSSGAAFLARARPRWAVISCGRHNPFGHPDARALRRLAASGARVRRTDRDGTVWLELGGQGARELDWTRGVQRDVRVLPTAPGARGALAGAPARW